MAKSVILEAAAFAAYAHKGQGRKWTGVPYITHPRRVAGHVATLKGATEQMVAAAFLHDVIEDCAIILATIEHNFGNEVAELVWWLTNPEKPEGMTRARHKAQIHKRLASAPKQAKRIKLCDRIDNLQEMDGAPGEFQVLYGEESLDLAEAIGDADETLKSELIQLVGRMLDE
jgi:(p)ppGpp synthase/HD superfamily hydrolase